MAITPATAAADSSLPNHADGEWTITASKEEQVRTLSSELGDEDERLRLLEEDAVRDELDARVEALDGSQLHITVAEEDDAREAN